MISDVYAITKDIMRLTIRPALLGHPDLHTNIVVISIITPGEAPVFQTDTDKIITVYFHDCTPIGCLREDKLKFCSTEDAEKIVAFIKKWTRVDESVIMYVNCSAGINRSGSTARFAAEYDNNVSFEKFVKDNPKVRGNDWVYMKLIEADFNLKQREW